MSELLIGFDSAWTAGNKGALVGVIRHEDGTFESLGLPVAANFDEAEQTILGWQADFDVDRTLILIDQPTIVKDASGQRPVENLVASPVSRRHGGMQPANTSRQGMFDPGAPIWPFLNRFGGPADFLACTRPTEVFETYPVLTIIARGWIIGDPHRITGRLPKYNPARKRTFSSSDWEFLCGKLLETFEGYGLAIIADWIKSIRFLASPRKGDQDRLDACLCLLVAMEMADGQECLLVGQQQSGYIAASSSAMIHDELAQRCIATKRNPSHWLHKWRLERNPSCSL